MNGGWVSVPVRVSRGVSNISSGLDVANLDWRRCHRLGKILLHVVCS
jgi:hypothetical protein